MFCIKIVKLGTNFDNSAKNGPKTAKIGPKYPKMGQEKTSFFRKKTYPNIQIWSVAAFHKKFSRCQNWDFWPVQPHCWMKLAYTLKIGLWELWKHQINQFQSYYRHLGHFWSFLAFFGRFWPFWPILASNLKLSQSSHVTTQNDRKRSRNPMEMVSDVIFRLLGLFLVI